MSPNEQSVTSGREAISIALSIYSTGVTQTGQPGPCTKLTSPGNSRSMPNRTNPVGLPAAHLHQGPRTRHAAGDGRRKAVRCGGIPVFVTELHTNPSREW